MGSALAPKVLLCADETAATEDLKRFLTEAGYSVVWHSTTAEPDELLSFNLVILESGPRHVESQQLCRRLRERAEDGLLPILYITKDHAPASRLAGFESGADGFLLRPFDPAELLAQVRAFLRMQELHQRLAEKTTEIHRINRRLQEAQERINQELELARRIQQSFLPQSLPELPEVRFAVHYRPCGRVGGDFYDVFRLDENHVGYYVADAVGHGVPASLLTIFLKKAVRAKEIFGKQYRLIPPDEVLQRLNRDLLEQGLSENPFITMIYGLFHFRDGTFRFARAGHPHPLYVPADREPEAWKTPGPILGVFEAEFTIQSRSLRPGDKVLFYTDGIDSATFEDHRSGLDSLTACAARYQHLPIEEFVPKLSLELKWPDDPTDDITFLGMEAR